MHVIHVSKYLPTFRGGIERVTDVMASAIVESGGKVEVVGVDPSVNRGQVRTSPYPEQIIKSFGKLGPVELAPGFANFASWLERADVVHLHLPHPIVETALRFPHRLGRAKLVPIIHAPLSSYGAAGWVWRNLVQNPVLEQADAVLAATGEILTNISYYRSLKRKALITPFPAAPVAPKFIAEASDRCGDNRQDPVRLVSLGRLVAYKGFHVLLEAMAKCTASLRLDLVGDGPQKGRLERLIVDHGLGDRVFLHGNVDDDRKNELLGNADLVVVPSISTQEGYGLTIAEAFAAQRAVVLTDVPTGMAFLARQGDCGAVVARGNAEALAAAVDQMASDPARRQRAGRNNFHFWQQELRPEVFAARYVSGLQALLDA